MVLSCPATFSLVLYFWAWISSSSGGCVASQPPAEAESCSSLFEVAQCKSWNQGWQEASRISTAVASASRSMPPSMASQKNWMCRKCWVTTPMNVLYCHSCHSWWQTVLHTQSRSKSRKRKKQKPKKGESKEARENVLCLTPLSNRKKGARIRRECHGSRPHQRQELLWKQTR